MGGAQRFEIRVFGTWLGSLTRCVSRVRKSNIKPKAIFYEVRHKCQIQNEDIHIHERVSAGRTML